MGRETKAQKRRRQKAAKRRYGKSPAQPRPVFGCVANLPESQRALGTEELADLAIKVMGFVDLHEEEVPLRHNKKNKKNKKMRSPLRVEQPDTAVPAAVQAPPSASVLMMRGLGLM